MVAVCDSPGMGDGVHSPAMGASLLVPLRSHAGDCEQSLDRVGSNRGSSLVGQAAALVSSCGSRLQLRHAQPIEEPIKPSCSLLI